MSTRARREREKQRRRDSILAAAQAVFLEEGFYRATVDSVAERAEVSKGTVYLYFDSKETLLAALLLEGLDALIEALEAAYAPAQDYAADERLRRLSAAYFQFFHDEPHYFRFLMAMDRGRFRDSVAPDMYQEVLKASLEGLSWVVKAVEQGVTSGLFVCCDVNQAAATLWATLNGVLELMAHPLRRDIVAVEPAVLYYSASETVIRGLLARS
ncbi:MAG: helix-turn-helix transcriptional regulator [Anaerolineae bacterium]|nr:helix-turn-helix transcriptional regulator [Anaerolineae bacterium]